MNDTQFLQTFLHGAGVWKGAVDGKASSQLANALAVWQHSQGMTATGEYDLATRSHMAQVMTGLSGTKSAFQNLDPKIQLEATARYGAGLMAYLTNPEIGPIIIQGAKEHRDLTWLQGQLQQTDYWKKTSDNARSWDTLLVTNPGQASQLLQNSMGHVKDVAGSAGISLSMADLRRIGEDSARFQWDDPTLRDILANTVKFNPKTPQGGDIGSMQAQLQSAAADQLINLDDKTALTYATRVFRGEGTLDGYKKTFQNQAVARYPHLADAIKQGSTLKEYFDPIKQDIANTLEVAPDSINLTKGPFAQVVDVVGDKGVHRSMTRSEAVNLARQQPGYQQTAGANDDANQLFSTVAKSMGAMA